MGIAQTTRELLVNLPGNLKPQDLRRLLDSGVTQDFTPISPYYVARTTPDGRLEIIARISDSNTKSSIYSSEEVAKIRAYLQNPWQDVDIPGI